MRVVVTGATGNVGTALMRDLLDEPDVDSIVAVSRRSPGEWPEGESEQVSWVEADVVHDDLVSVFAGADVVVHLAWLFQPTHKPAVTWEANVLGSRRVMDAVAEAGVGALVVASSVGAYSPRVSLEPVDESYPTHGVPTAAYSREKAYLERMLDGFCLEHPSVRVVRMRPGFIFQRTSAAEQRRLFLGPLVPTRVVTRLRTPVLPDPGGSEGLHMQTLHSKDAARAYRLAVTREVEGAFNIAADPVIDMDVLAEAYGARRVRLPSRPVRAAVAAAWLSHLIPASAGLFDLMLQIPVMSTQRAREELGWAAEYTSVEAIDVLLRAMRSGADGETPPLASETSGPARSHEFGTGIGSQP